MVVWLNGNVFGTSMKLIYMYVKPG